MRIENELFFIMASHGYELHIVLPAELRVDSDIMMLSDGSTATVHDVAFRWKPGTVHVRAGGHRMDLLPMERCAAWRKKGAS